MAALTQFQTGTGGLLEKEDPRDLKWEKVALAKSSTPFDWTVGYDVEAQLGIKLPVKNQDGSDSCGGQATSTYASVLERAAGYPFSEKSSKFIYSQVFAPGGGSDGRALCDLLVKEGVSTEALCPSYLNGQPANETFYEQQDITQAARDDAWQAKDVSYALVNTDLESVAQAVRDNYGCLLGIVGSNNNTWGSDMPQPPKDGETFWYHWLYIGKAEIYKGKKGVWALNSWGPNYGVGGWQFISEDYFSATINSSYGTSPIFTPRTIVFDYNYAKQRGILFQILTLLKQVVHLLITQN